MQMMKLAPVAALALALILPALAGSAAPACGQVLVNEIMADPAGDWDGDSTYSFRDDEWVEIVNTGPSIVSLAGFRLAGADTSWRYEFSGTLDPGAVTVVYGSQSYAWEQANGEPAYGLRLGNTGGYIALWRIAGEDTVLADCYTYADHEAEDDRSTGRYPDGAETWKVFDGMNPYDGTEPPAGTGCLPSPGAPATCTTPVEASTWGLLKRLYR